MKSKDIKGVHGWLNFLVLILIVLNPLGQWILTGDAIFSTERLNPSLTTSEIWSHLKIVSWASVCISSFIGIYAGIALIRSTKRETVHYAIAALWVLGPITTVIANLIISYISGVNVFADQAVLSTIIKTVIFSSLWTAYLVRSQRVRNTYT